MFDLSWAEMGVIAVVALLVIGPKDIPKVAAFIKKALRKAASLKNDFMSGINDLTGEDTELKNHVSAINSEIRHIIDLEGNVREAYPVPDFSNKTAQEDHDR